MENKEILENEIKRIMLLYSYNQKNTLTENLNNITKEPILEQLRGGAEELAKVARELEAARNLKATAGEFKAVSAESRALEKEIMSSIKGGIVADGKQLKTIDEVLTAMKEGKLGDAAKGQFIWSSMKNLPPNSASAKLYAKEIATTPSTIKRYSNVSKDIDIVNDLMKNKNLSKQQAELVLKEIKNVKAEAGIVKDTKALVSDTKTLDDEVKAFDDEIKRLDDEIRKTKQSTELKGKQKELVDAKTLEAREANELRNAESALTKEVKAGKKGPLYWLKKAGYITGKVIFNKYFLFLAAGIGGFLLWKNYFSDNGIKIEGEGKDTGSNEKKERYTGGGDTVSQETTDWKNNPNAGDGESGDPLLGKYKACSGTYKIACSEKMGDPVIRKLQMCVSVKPTGKWGEKTNVAVLDKFGKDVLTAEEIKDGCLVGGSWS